MVIRPLARHVSCPDPHALDGCRLRHLAWRDAWFSLVATALVAVIVAASAVLGGRDLGAPPRPAGPSTTVLSSLPNSGEIAPGTYAIAKPTGSVADYVRLIVTLPAGWATNDGVVHKRLGQAGAVELSGWTVFRVYDPCHWQTSSQSEVDLGLGDLHAIFHARPTGSALPKPARGGLANQKGRSASGLTKVNLGGQAALKIELSITAGLDISTCDSPSAEHVLTSRPDIAAGGRIDSRFLIVRPSLGCSLAPITPPGNDESDQLKQAIQY